MSRKLCGNFVATGLIMGVFLLAGPAPVTAQAKKPKPAGKPVSQAAPANLPEITRIAVFQDQRGEQTIRSPLAFALDDKSGDMIVTSSETGELVVFDKNGKLVKRLGTDSGLVSPYGVALDAKGRIYVSEVRSGFLKILSPSGTLVDEIDLSTLLGKTVAPGRIMLGRDGFLYVTDLKTNEILVLNEKGKFVRSVGEFTYLQKGGAVNGDRIVGLSGQGRAVQVFDREGALLHSFGDHGDSPDRNFSFPTGFAVDARGRLWIADAFQHRLKVFSLDGKLLFNFGQMEEKEGGFFFPVDLCFGARDTLYVLEKGANRIQVFRIGDLRE